MKLILLTLLISLADIICAQKFQQDQYPFPPQFQTPNSGFSSDSSIYLPPESHSPIPYFTMNNLNKLPYQFLPPTGTKAPSMFPTSFPMFMSSTLRFDDEEDEDNEEEEKSSNQTPVPIRVPQNNFNRANNNTLQQVQEKKDGNFNSRMSNQQTLIHQSSQSIQPRFDVRPPSYVTIGPKEREQKSINPAARRMIITSEIHKSEQSPELAKAASFQSSQYIHAPGVFISSTTEPAIPILRLSNEMDLDGSFSYEALGADQTHYVQHSRMENMGSDKEEQVVEGSYSYVGDDGRTYTVHYVADSKGFRATGDHLPVPPPIPEIIQRAVQYNLAEEAKKPPHVRASWENDDKEYEINDRSFYNNLPPPPSSRNLFTGKTPEAFSFGYSHGSNKDNNLVAAESFQVPSKQNFEMQSKPKVNPVPAPQVTFLASQGAHNPSTPQQAPTKTSISEKSSLPQLMNYEAEIKDTDQETNKALWRWQYGLNGNMEQSPKHSISRSFGEGDDVIINFSNMTPDQYTSMIHTQILPQNAETSNQPDYNSANRYYQDESVNKTVKGPEEFYVTTEKTNPYTQQIVEIMKKENTNTNTLGQINFGDNKSVTRKETSLMHPDIITRQNFIPQSQIATQSYNFDETSFEPSKITTPHENDAVNLQTIYKISQNDISSNYNERLSTIEPMLNTLKTTSSYNERPSTIEPMLNTLKTTSNIYVDQENSSFRPIIYNSEKVTKQETTTTEASMSEMLRENMFLRNLFKTSTNEEKLTQQPTLEHYKLSSSMNIEKPEIKNDKESKYIHIQETPQNEIKFVKSKPLDINNILNYAVLKNHFESVKTKQKSKPIQHFIQTSKVKDIPTHYIPINENTNYYVEPNDEDMKKQDNDFKTLNRQHQHELQGLIKNYKVLQRQKQKSQILPEPQKHIKIFHTQSLPPLGRAGPSMKSYLPPTYS